MLKIWTLPGEMAWIFALMIGFRSSRAFQKVELAFAVTNPALCIITISNREQQPFVYFSTRIRPKAGADSGFDTNWSTTAVVTFTASDHPAFPTPAVRPALLASPKAPVPSTHLTIQKTIRTILTASIASPEAALMYVE